MNKMSKNGLLVVAICFLLGVGSAFYSGKIMCFLGNCMLVTSGDNLFNKKGINIDQGTANFIRIIPYIAFGASGIFLMGELVKSEKKG